MLESRSAPSQTTIRLQLLALWPDLLLLARKREAFDAQGTCFVENASVLNKMWHLYHKLSHGQRRKVRHKFRLHLADFHACIKNSRRTMLMEASVLTSYQELGGLKHQSCWSNDRLPFYHGSSWQASTSEKMIHTWTNSKRRHCPGHICSQDLRNKSQKSSFFKGSKARAASRVFPGKNLENQPGGNV